MVMEEEGLEVAVEVQQVFMAVAHDLDHAPHRTLAHELHRAHLRMLDRGVLRERHREHRRESLLLRLVLPERTRPDI